MEQILQSLNGVYLTLNQLDIKATPSNTKYMYGVYTELERCIQFIQQVGDENEWQQENTEA